MVGVPGRSKGCTTCKKRKVRCDEAKPVCNRCKNAFMLCEGYSSPPTVFVNETKRFVKWEPPGEQVQDLRTSHGSLALGGPIAFMMEFPYRQQDTSEFDDFDGSSDSSASSFVVLDTARSSTSPPSSPPSQLGLGAFRENIWVSYLADNLFPGGGYASDSWIISFIAADTTTVAYPTACCLGAIMFARSRQESITTADMRAGALYYGKALHQLNSNLQHPDLCMAPANLAASLLLGVYELAMFKDGSGWLQHAGGVSRLIEMRGPESHKTEPARTYLKINRVPIISQALAARKRTFLEYESWRSTHFDIGGFNQKTNGRLIDLFAKIPGLLEDSDNLLMQPSEAQSTSISGFQTNLIAIISDLFHWRWSWEYEYPEICYEVLADASMHLSVDGHEQPFYETLLFYHDFHTSREPMLYNAALLIIFGLSSRWGIIDPAAKAISLLTAYQAMPVPPARNPLTMPHSDLSMAEICSEMCRSIEYNLQPPHQKSGALNLLMPLRILSKIGGLGEVDAKWLGKVTKKMAKLHGFHFSERLEERRSIAEDVRL